MQGYKECMSLESELLDHLIAAENKTKAILGTQAC